MEQVGIVGDAVNPKFSEVIPRIDIVVDRDQIRSAVEPVFKPSQRGQKRTTCVAEHNPQSRQAFQDATENHGARSPCRFRRHAHQPRQPILFHLLLPHHVPRVNHQGHSQSFARIEKWKEAFVRDVHSVDV